MVIRYSVNLLLLRHPLRHLHFLQETGMIASKEMMELIAQYLHAYPEIPYVIDPVMLAKSGDALMDDEAKADLQNILLPYATLNL